VLQRNKYGLLLLLLALVIVMLLNFIFLKPIWWKADVLSIRNIKHKGYLTLITQTNSTGYFIYKDDTLGFEYEIAKAFAEDLGVQLRVKNAVQYKHILSGLLAKQGDIAAGGFIVSNSPDEEVAFSTPYTTTEQVLVRHSSSQVASPLGSSGDSSHQIVVPENYPALNVLQNMAVEAGSSLQVRTVGNGVCTEDLIREVSEGKIAYTIAPKELALVNKAYYDNINTEVSVTAPQEVAFCLRSKDKVFRTRFDEWLQDFVHSKAYYDLYKKYFQVVRSDMPFLADSTSNGIIYISQYDLLLQKYAENIGWDWRLLAALVWQESKFKPKARSWCGATGLMQLMPKTARRFGVMSTQAMYHPESNIQGGTRYIEYLQKYWKNVADPVQRTKFILGSYNAGEGHVSDAVRLAKKYGYKTDVWDGNVEYFLLNKSKPQFYKDPVCKNGYCRGSEPFAYVRNIIKKYISYTKNKQLPTDDMNQNYLAYVQPETNFDFNFSTTKEDGDYEAYTATVVPSFKKELFTGTKILFQNQPLSSGNTDTSKYHNTLNFKQGYKRKDELSPKVPGQGKKQLFKEKELFEEKHQQEDARYYDNLKTRPRQ
jgi:membrane-bound lytic murein transglycosylase F